MKNEQDNKKTEEQESEKKVYSKPQLVEHGSIAKLTQFGGSAAADFFFGQQA